MTMEKSQGQTRPDYPVDFPPAYSEAVKPDDIRRTTLFAHTESDVSRSQPNLAPTSSRSTSCLPSRSTSRTGQSLPSKPIVIPREYQRYTQISKELTFSPETTKTWRGAFASPYVRAYPPSLANLPSPISQHDFMTFIDGLNEAWSTAPAFLIGGLIGTAMSTVPLMSVSLAGTGVSTASGIAGAGVSYARTRTFIGKANAEMFLPRGLRVKVLKTEKMMKAVEMPQVSAGKPRLQLPPLERIADVDAAAAATRQNNESRGTEPIEQDPRMRRMAALEGYVEPLDFNVPTAVAPDNWYKKMGAAQARRVEAKQTKKIQKDRREDAKKGAEKAKDTEKEVRECDEEIAKIERKMDKERAKAEKELAKGKETYKVEKELAKELAKLEKDRQEEIAEKEKELRKADGRLAKKSSKGDKEQEKTMKIYWIVIMKEADAQATQAADLEEEDGSESDAAPSPMH